MRPALVVIGALAVLILASAGALATPIGGKTHEVKVPGQGANLDAPETGTNADALAVKARAKLGVDDAEAKVREPTCDLKTGTEATASKCAGPNVQTTAPKAGLDYDVGVTFGRLEAAEPAASTQASYVANPATTLAEAEIPRTLVIAAASASALTVGAYLAWRLLKLLGLGALVPLYSHIEDDELLDEGNRARIFELIEKEPGVSTRDVAQRLGLAWGTVTHHLWKLEKRRLVVSKKYGKYRRYFANGAAPTEDRDAIATLKVARTEEVASYIRAHPGITQKEVGEGMGVSSSTILWHVKRLEQVGLVMKVRDGKAVRYYPRGAETTFEVVHPAQPAIAGGAAPVRGATPVFRP